MSARSLIAIALLLASCDQRKPGASREDARLAQAINADIAKIRAGNPGIKNACLEKLRANKLGAFEWADNPHCYDMLPDQNWSGLWNSGWEWTNFCSDPAKECGATSDRGGIWLIFAKGAYSGPELRDGVYHIDFVGRRTKIAGYFGHQAQYDHLMVVDRIISIEHIPGEKYSKRF